MHVTRRITRNATRHLARWGAALALLAPLALTTAPAAAQPAVAFDDGQPRMNAVMQANPMAAPTGSTDPSFEISFDITMTNQEPGSIFLRQVTMDFGPGITPASATLDAQLEMSCGGGTPQRLSVSNEMKPGVSCRVLLLDDPAVQPHTPEFIELSFFFEGYDDKNALTITAPTVSYWHDQPDGGYLFPAKATDLRQGEFWSGRSGARSGTHRQGRDSMFAYDMGLVRWDDDTGAWTAFHPLSDAEPDNGDENDDYLVWEQPIYSMADGVVVSCVDGNPDMPPGVDSPIGNSFTIDHGDERARYWHLKNGSLNPLICFPGALVEAGEYLAQVGNNGRSDFPHLHLDVTRGGQGFPLMFRDAFLVDRSAFDDPESPVSNADWSYVHGQALPFERNALYPSPMVRRGTETGGRGDGIDVLDLNEVEKITAAKNAQGRLDLRSWSKIGNGDLSQTDQVTGETIQQVALAEPSVVPFFVTAVRTSTNQLKLTEWSANLADGPSAFGGTAFDVDMTTSPHMPGLVTATVNLNGKLQVMGWDYVGGISITMGDVVVGPTAVQTRIATGSAFDGVVTASVTKTGKLHLASWSVNANETFIALQDELLDIDAKQVEIAHLGEVGGDDRFVTATRDPLGFLDLVTWNVEPNGTITRLDDLSGIKAGDISIADGGVHHALVAVRDFVSDELKLFGIEMDAAGNMTEHGVSGGEKVREVAMGQAMTVVGTREQAVLFVRDTSNSLKLISWELGLEP